MGFKKKVKKAFGKVKTVVRNNPRNTAKVLQGANNILKNNRNVMNQYKKLTHPAVRGKINAMYKAHTL